MSLYRRRLCAIVAGGGLAALLCAPVLLAVPASAQTAPSATELASYTGLHRAAARGDAAEIRALLAKGGDPNAERPVRANAAARRGLRLA